MKFKNIASVALLAVAALVLTGSGPANDGGQAGGFEFTKTFLDVEVVANGLSTETSGGAFIIEGYIYPAGTIDGDNGINDDGSPEFPDEVIGTWTCRGWAINGRTEGDVIIGASSTQTFEMDPASLGKDMIVTSGLELASLNVTLTRAITGGTGQYTTLKGEQLQTIVGVNVTGGGNFSVQFSRTVDIQFKRSR